jgi:hypothetical protein
MGAVVVKYGLINVVPAWFRGLFQSWKELEIAGYNLGKS